MKLWGVQGNRHVEICDQLEIADTMWTRFVGLMGRSGLGDGAGLWIRSCNSIHTFFMRFSIDVLFVGEGDRVVALARRVAPFRMLMPRWGAHSVVELPSGAIDRRGLAEGMELKCQ